MRDTLDRLPQLRVVLQELFELSLVKHEKIAEPLSGR